MLSFEFSLFGQNSVDKIKRIYVYLNSIELEFKKKTTTATNKQKIFLFNFSDVCEKGIKYEWYITTTKSIEKLRK